MRLTMLDEDQNPIYVRPYPLSTPMLTYSKSAIEELLRVGHIRPIESEWNAPVVFVKKPGHTVESPNLRFCVSYVKLNAKLIDSAYGMATCRQCLDCLVGASYFAVLDLKNGFHQIALAPEDQHGPPGATVRQL